MENISAHITYLEATKSITALKFNIDNTPDAEQLKNIQIWANELFEPLRLGLGSRPINISILFRCAALNRIIPGASPTSQHMAFKGAAGDLDNEGAKDGPTNREIFFYIKNWLEFDQLIWEYGDELNPDWVHVSYNKSHNRKEVLVSYKDKLGYFKYNSYKL